MSNARNIDVSDTAPRRAGLAPLPWAATVLVMARTSIEMVTALAESRIGRGDPNVRRDVVTVLLTINILSRGNSRPGRTVPDTSGLSPPPHLAA